MEQNFLPMVRAAQLAQAGEEAVLCNRVTEGYGLSISPDQIRALTERRMEALRATDRVELGPGVLRKLIFAFRDSHYLVQRDYEEVLGELQDLFYQLKNKIGVRLTDDELIAQMKTAFDGRAGGSVELIEHFLEPEKEEIREGDSDGQ